MSAADKLIPTGWIWGNYRDDASFDYHFMSAREAALRYPDGDVPRHFSAVVDIKAAKIVISDLEYKVRQHLAEEERRQKERGDYWLSEEGREKLKETFDDREDGNAVRPLLDRLELLEEHIRQLGDL